MRKLLPTITNPDIVNYLLFTPSPYTADDLKSKSTKYYRPVTRCVMDVYGIVRTEN